MKLVQHFPWQRFAMMLIFSAILLFTMQKFVDWLYYFVTIDPKLTSPAVQTAAITALSAGAGVLFICFSAVQIWFITGSVRSVEAMFRFNAATVAQTALSAAAQATETRERIYRCEKLDAKDIPDADTV